MLDVSGETFGVNFASESASPVAPMFVFPTHLPSFAVLFVGFSGPAINYSCHCESPSVVVSR
jgi:hypothetical protein